MLWQDSGLLAGSGAAMLTKVGGLRVSSVEPLSAGGSLTISKAALSTPILTNASISAGDIKTNILSVSGVAELGGDVFVDGSVNVRGSVIGSGPYIDSSDKRFKTNITTINSAIDKVMQLEGVRVCVEQQPSFSLI